MEGAAAAVGHLLPQYLVFLPSGHSVELLEVQMQLGLLQRRMEVLLLLLMISYARPVMPIQLSLLLEFQRLFVRELRAVQY